MAIRSIGSWEDGLINATLVYDGSNRITAIEVDNQSDQSIYLEAVQGETVGVQGRKYAGTFLPHTLTSIPIGTGVSVRILQLWDPARSRFSGIDLTAIIPAP